jgi:ATP-dependent phosphoenolpyruvate carboxykinase
MSDPRFATEAAESLADIEDVEEIRRLLAQRAAQAVVVAALDAVIEADPPVSRFTKEQLARACRQLEVELSNPMIAEVLNGD